MLYLRLETSLISGYGVRFTDISQVSIIIITAPIKLGVQVSITVNAASQLTPESQRQAKHPQKATAKAKAKQIAKGRAKARRTPNEKPR